MVSFIAAAIHRDTHGQHQSQGDQRMILDGLFRDPLLIFRRVGDAAASAILSPFRQDAYGLDGCQQRANGR